MSSSSVEQWALCAGSTHDVHHAIVGVNVVIGVLVVHCELLVVRVVPVVVCDNAVVRRTLVLIAFIVAFVFVVAIFHRILLYWRYSVYNFFPILSRALAVNDRRLVSLPPGLHISLWRFLFQWSNLNETCPRITQILTHRRSNNRRCGVIAKHPSLYE